MTNLIMLDVDGVINAVPRRGDALRPAIESGPDLWTQDKWDTLYAKAEDGNHIQYVINYNHDAVDALNTLKTSTDITFKWLTTWLEYAPNVYGAAGFDCTGIETVQNARSIDLPRWQASDKRDGTWWKWGLLLPELASGQWDRAVFVDDDISFYRRGTVTYPGWAIHTIEGVETLLICPHTEYGIRPSDIDLINDFLGIEN